MKFTDTLKELEAKAAASLSIDDMENFNSYLRNHAQDFINLVEAAEEWQSWIDRPVSHSEGKLIAALAALNKEKNNG